MRRNVPRVSAAISRSSHSPRVSKPSRIVWIATPRSRAVHEARSTSPASVSPSVKSSTTRVDPGSASFSKPSRAMRMPAARFDFPFWSRVPRASKIRSVRVVSGASMRLSVSTSMIPMRVRPSASRFQASARAPAASFLSGSVRHRLFELSRTRKRSRPARDPRISARPRISTGSPPAVSTRSGAGSSRWTRSWPACALESAALASGIAATRARRRGR